MTKRASILKIITVGVDVENISIEIHGIDDRRKARNGVLRTNNQHVPSNKFRKVDGFLGDKSVTKCEANG